jgi:SAM-dependent methyltransferase
VKSVLNLEQERLIALWLEEETKPFSGWDFSYLEGRMHCQQPPWSYRKRAIELMESSSAVLDMGTGGGEFLLELQTHWPGRVAVTEDYLPNYEFVLKRLKPLQVRIEFVNLDEGSSYPFEDQEFDLVLNRHSSMNPAEVARILAPGGTFLTQQVHGLWGKKLMEFFDVEPTWPDAVPEYYIPRLGAAGLEIVEMEDWIGRFWFKDVGAVVYYLANIPWMVPGFSVESHVDYLLRLQQILEEEHDLVFQARQYYIEARAIEKKYGK